MAAFPAEYKGFIVGAAMDGNAAVVSIGEDQGTGEVSPFQFQAPERLDQIAKRDRLFALVPGVK